MMNGCGNFEFSLVSNELAHLSHAVYILRGEPMSGAKIETPRAIIGWSMSDEWLVLWDWLEHGGPPKANLFSAPMKTDAAVTNYLENWIQNSPMILRQPDIDGSVEDDAYEIVSHRWRWESGRRAITYPEVGEVFSIRRAWSEYHK